MSFNSTLYLKDNDLPLDSVIKPKVTKLHYQLTRNHPEWSELARAFPNLIDLEISHSGNVPSRVPDAALFSSFDKLECLRGLGLQLFPKSRHSEQAATLSHLILINSDGETLPPWLKSIKNISGLTLVRPSMASLDELSELPFLSNIKLELHHYDHPNDLPIPSFACLLKAPALRQLEIELSPQAQDTAYLAPLACLVDLPQHIELKLNVYSRVARSDELNKLLGILQNAELTGEQRRHYWLLLLATPKPKNLQSEKLDARFHLTFMEAKFNPVKVLAQAWLRSRAQVDAQRSPLGPDCVLFICGKSGFKATELKEKAAELGFSLSKTLDSKVTHIVLGSNPKLTAAIDVDQHLIIDDTVLSQWFSADAPKFLQQTSAAPMLDNVLDMLRSPDETSHLVAITMLEQGGITSEMQLPLFLILKTTDNKALRKQIQTLLAGLGDNLFQLAVQDRVTFDGKMRGLNKHGDPIGEGAVYKKLKGLNKRWGKALCDEFSLLYFNRFGEGLLWLLNQKEELALRQQAIQALVEGERLNWHKGCGFERMLTLGDDDRRVNCHLYPDIYLRSDELHNIKAPLPVELPSKTRITELDLHNCLLGELPANIMHYVDVTVLNLHFNHLSSLPATLATLSNIEDLDLSYNHFDEFPAVLFKLTNLKRLDLRRARQPTGRIFNHHYDTSQGYQPISAPKAFRDALPDCEILEDL
ncbi:BRCT domain-containing protein [Shewanella pealeana]|nr:BRCT domain-containing protein [Shewanella pealeana]